MIRYTRRWWMQASARAATGGAATALLAGVLGACSQPGEGQADSRPEAAPATVQFYFSGDQATGQLYVDLKEAFERKYPNYKLDLIHGENEIEKALALMAAGTPPDVYWNRVRWSQTLIRREGTLVDLLPLMKRDKITQDDFWPSAVNAYSYKGAFYGLPTSASSNAVYFNKNHFRQAGVPFPDELEKQGKWNWDSLLDAAKKLTRVDSATSEKRYGFNRPSGLVLSVQYMWQNGGKPFSDDRTQCLLNSKESVGGVQFITDLVLKHQVTPTVENPDKADFRTSLKVAMEQAGRYILPSIVPALQSGSLDAGMVVAPKGPKKDSTRGDDLAASILKSSKVQEAAWAYAKLWSSEEGQLIVLKSNRSYTARRSVARNQSILKQVLHPWENGEMYFTGLNRTEVFPVTPRFIDVTSIYAAEEKAAHAGQKTPQQAMDSACQQIAPLLKEPF
ncbi:MAG: sugar ABC transporter substrate-binding protein [Chloroflexi bacterium]|nr:sugar ABC transporter substrate-binding protein [Chloroflexota bacterium]